MNLFRIYVRRRSTCDGSRWSSADARNTSKDGDTLSEEISRARDGWLHDSLARKDNLLFAGRTPSINVCIDVS